MEIRRMGRIPVDPKVIREIQRSPAMRAEQGPGFMQSWGGPKKYQEMARLPMEERLVYAAVLEGHTVSSDIEVVTGLGSEEVGRGLAGLKRRGLVHEEETT